jgi:hypothetical protein
MPNKGGHLVKVGESKASKYKKDETVWYKKKEYLVYKARSELVDGDFKWRFDIVIKDGSNQTVIEGKKTSELSRNAP